MPIKLKVASTAKELNDVFELRHSVYVVEKKRFRSRALNGNHIVDRFDAIPDVVNFIAYSGETAVATMRLNKDSAIGLPAEEYFDFSHVRSELDLGYRSGECERPLLGSGSMLAIHKAWRHRRDVIFALFKLAAGVALDWGVTHGIGSISQETFSLYSKIGFEAIGEPKWNEAVNDTLLPIFVPYERVFDWTFGEISTEISPFWLENFSGQCERLLLSPGDVLFSQGDEAGDAYAIDEGWISISRKDEDNNEMIFAHLSKGALFGELAILDDEPRSAAATAITNVELVVLERDRLLDIIRLHPEKTGELLRHFSKRLRDLDDLAMVQAFAPQTSRVIYALQQLWHSATTDRKDANIRIAKVGPDQIAKSAQVREDEVLWVLETEKVKGTLDYGKKRIRFFKLPVLGRTYGEGSKFQPV